MLSLEERGDLAYETGDYVATVLIGAGGTEARTGKYIVVWKRPGDERLVVAAIWNMNNDAAGL